MARRRCGTGEGTEAVLRDRRIYRPCTRSEPDRCVCVKQSRWRRAIDSETRERSIVVSTISAWELFRLVKRGRLELSVPPAAFVTATRADPLFVFRPVDEGVVRRSVELPDVHRDPADRMILATAAELGASIVSRDARFASHDAAPVIW